MQIDQVLDEIARLPAEFTPWGTLRDSVLRALVRHCGDLKIKHSVETGTGRSTLLLSHLSEHHTVFSLSSFEQLGNVQGSSILRKESVHFVEGPTQRTLPLHDFKNPIQLAFLDGPHAYPFPELEYFFTYPHMDPGGILVVDDIHIPTINHLFKFLRDDKMWDLAGVEENTAFFRRTEAPTFDPYGDNWEGQVFNDRHLPALTGIAPVRNLKNLVREKMPKSLRNKLRVVPLD